jgi:uncharacterized integral membrane protein (TIGR00697 family)
VIASLLGYLTGQLLNAFVLVKLKERSGEKKLWVRLVGSTVVGEFADTVVFCLVAWAFVLDLGSMINYIITGYLYKTLIEVLCLPITYRVIAWVKRNEPGYIALAA